MSIDRRMLLRGALACACCAKAGLAMASDAPAHGGAAAATGATKATAIPRSGANCNPTSRCASSAWSRPRSTSATASRATSARSIMITSRCRSASSTTAIPSSSTPIPAAPASSAARAMNCCKFHIHHPSEHLLAGKGFDLECHFVHKSSAGALAVTGVFIPPGAANAALKTFFEQMPAKAGPEVKVRGRSISRAFCRRRRLFPLHGFADDAALFGRPDLDGPQGAGRGVGRADPEIRRTVSKRRPLQKRNRRFVIDAS